MEPEGMTKQDLHLQEVKSEQDLMVKENGAVPFCLGNILSGWR
jgi:hypothetical protein